MDTRGRSHRQAGRVCALIVGVALLALQASPSAEAHASGSCQLSGHDYLRPLERLPVLRDAHADGTLPFGPAWLSFSQSAQQVLVEENIGGSEVFTDFTILSGVDIPDDLDLGWQITSRLLQINTAGELRRKMGEKTAILHTLVPASLERASASFWIPGRPAFYRLENVFRTSTGRVLGRFGRYYRAVRPTVGARVAVSETSNSSGDVIHFGIENLGSREISSGLGFAIERFSSSTWSVYGVPSGQVGRVRARLGPGAVGPCQSYVLPADIGPGMYRIAAEVDFRVRGGHYRSGTVYGRFEVVP